MTDNKSVFVVIPNWNGEDHLANCLDSLEKQTLGHIVVVVENGSHDGSLKLLKKYADVVVLEQAKNLGFAGGVNVGIKYALDNGASYIALLNNDAEADPKWLESLASTLDDNFDVGIVASKMQKGTEIDSTGEHYSVWGLAFPRDRGLNANSPKLDQAKDIFSASGGASMYRAMVFNQIGLFDNDFFAYYEDMDLSIRARLVGWKIQYNSKATVQHLVGATSSKIKGLTTYQTLKNTPWVIYKDLPFGILIRVLPRFTLIYTLVFIKSLFSSRALYAIKGLSMSLFLLPKKLFERHRIQKQRIIDPKSLWQLMHHDLPPNASAMRRLRSFILFWRKS